MKFGIDTFRTRYSKEGSEKLSEIGFEFKFIKGQVFPYEKVYGQKVFIEINSLYELIALSKRINEKIILDSDDTSIEIYDDY